VPRKRTSIPVASLFSFPRNIGRDAGVLMV
jgi:hypothetical protein